MAGGTQRQTVATGNGVVFEVVFKNADPGKKPGHGISLSYAGQIYSCNDAESARSVHTIHTDDEDDDASNKSPCHGKNCGRSSPPEPSPSSACLKKSPRRSTLQDTPLLKPSPKKPKRSRTLSPSHQSRVRSILAPLSTFSRKLSFRRHSYDESAKTQREKSQIRQEKAKPQLDQRSIMHNISPGFQQAPPHFAYQNQVPMYHYTPVLQPQSVYGAVPIAYSMAPGAANTAPQIPPELQQLQGHINHVTAILAANPIDLYAKRELDRLLAERNSFLNSATQRTAPAAASGHNETPNPRADDARSITEKESVIGNADGDEVHIEVAPSIAARDASSAPKHHICSGCGEARSPSFHRKHPFAKPVHNVCRKCREGKRASSVMNRYHFCSSCGIVRSKEYHRRRGSATAVSKRSQICCKCHAYGNSVHQPVNKTSREVKAPPTDDRKHKPVGPKPAAHNTPQKGPVKVEPRVRPMQPHRQSGSAGDAACFGHDGVSSLDPCTHKTTRTENEFHPVKEEAPTTYRSPTISDDDGSSNQPVSLESSFDSSGPESPLCNARSASTARSPKIFVHDSASEASLHAPQQTTTATNPYYQPRNTAARLSSPFHCREAARGPSPPIGRASSQDAYSPASEHHHSGPGSPNLHNSPHKPRFVDRNLSWPGDLNLPGPGAFSHMSGTARQVSASDGAPSPTTRDRPSPAHHHDDGGERFTKGAFGKLPASFKPSPPASPWASFSGPIQHPDGSKGAFYEPSSNASQTSHESFFGRYHHAPPPPPPPPSEPVSPVDPPSFPPRFRQTTSYPDRDEFASTRGAWNINTAASAFARSSGHDHVPEPIIEEPSSPPRKSPLTTPLLLEFNLAEDMSDSGVEFLTDPSSPSSASSSSPSAEEESLLAAHLDGLAVHNH